MRLVSFLFSFEGRINRESYWLFFGSCIVLSIVLQIVFGAAAEGVATILSLILLWPAAAIIVKRYHDCDRSGGWVLVHFLIPPLGIYQCGFLPGTPGINRYGPEALGHSKADDGAAAPRRKLLYLLGGVALFLFGCLLSTFIVENLLFGTALEFSESASGLAFTIALWWAAHFYLRRAFSQPSGWQKFILVAGIAMILFGCLTSHYIALNFLFGTSVSPDLAIPMLFTIVFLAGGALLSHLALSQPSGWQITAGLVYGKRLAIVITIFVVAFIAINGYVFHGMSRFFDKARASLRENPIFQKNIGEVVRFREDYTATGSKGNDIFVFKVEGTNGTGTVTAELKTIDRETERLVSGSVVLGSGESYDLFPGNR